MKKIILTMVSALLAAGVLTAQTLDDALRYSQTFYSGTARFNSMGGAFTALGADMSTLSQNPAGIGMYRSSEFSITPSLNFVNSTASFNGGVTEDYLNKFNIGQAGYVANVFKSQNAGKSFMFNIGYSYNMTNNFRQNVLVSGINHTSSMADSWAINSDMIPYNELKGPAGIAFDTYVIDTVTGYQDLYGTAYANYDDPVSVYGQRMKRAATYEGRAGEHAISFGGNYSDKIYFGVTFGINTLHFSSYSEHVETAETQLASGFQNFNYVDYYENDGSGFTFKIGAIAKPVEMLRVGVAFHSPTYYNIDEYFYDNISSKFTWGEHSANNDPMRYSYAMRTPSRLLAGVAVQIQKFGVITADYEYVNYGSALFSQTGDGFDYSDKNREIRTVLRSASNFRVGGEYRYQNLYLRGGYGYYGKPFEARENPENANLDYRTISAGIGFRAKGVSFDFGYVNYKSMQYNYLYYLPTFGGPASPGYDLTTSKNTFTFTIGFRFGVL
ncbi:MAG: hypothetical protein LBV26_05235 [Bacteroidales bacterium]|jgi:hypothetical protein|nr:hypothetical protein [Bacteroidales bacterium]